MKIYKFCLLAIFVLFLLSCDKETEGLSRSTYYVEFEMKGDNPAIVQVGEPYIDAGVIAKLQGKDVTSQIKIESNVNYKAMGLYQIIYTSPPNSDGLKSRVVRDVIVCNPAVTTDLSGTWDVANDCYRNNGGVIHTYGGKDYTVKISRIAPGFFAVDDFFAKYYTIYRGYGYAPVYEMQGYFSLDEDNSIKLIKSYVIAWGDGLNFMRNGIYDPDTDPGVDIVKWELNYSSGMEFFITLTKEKE